MIVGTGNQAETFVDWTATLRAVGLEVAAGAGITPELVRKHLAAHSEAPEDLSGPGRYSRFLPFRDGSTAAQVRGGKRWDVY